MENLNLVELLRDCPRGMELDCLMYDNLEFDYIDENSKFPIRCRSKITNVGYNSHNFTEYGEHDCHSNAKCVIFPKGKTTWEGFVPPYKFKDGDVLTYMFYNKPTIYIYREKGCCNTSYYAGYSSENKQFYKGEIGGLSGDRTDLRLATEDEKQKLFQVIKANGYRWNAETKTLEKLVEPIFRIGNKIEKCGYRFTIAEVKDDYYLTKCGNKIPIDNQDDFSLVPNKFDITTLVPFESRVLVRDYDNRMWIPTFWGKLLEDDSNCSYLTTNGCYKYCIPYDGNQHLLGTTNDCDDFYKTWK